jgi:hypothetical protein
MDLPAEMRLQLVEGGQPGQQVHERGEHGGREASDGTHHREEVGHHVVESRGGIGRVLRPGIRARVRIWIREHILVFHEHGGGILHVDRHSPQHGLVARRGDVLHDADDPLHLPNDLPELHVRFGDAPGYHGCLHGFHLALATYKAGRRREFLNTGHYTGRWSIHSVVSQRLRFGSSHDHLHRPDFSQKMERCEL